MQPNVVEKLNTLLKDGDLKEGIHLLKDELANSKDSFEACFLARDLAELYRQSSDETKAIHFGFLAGEGFVLEGEMFQAMAMTHWLKQMPSAGDKAEQLKVMISETFSITRIKRKDADSDVRIPTPFQEFSASIALDGAGDEKALHRNQLRENTAFHFALFSSLRSMETAALIELATLKKLSPGEVLYEENDPSAQFFIVVNGELLLSSKSGFKKTLGAGDFAGDVSYLAGHRRGATLKAETKAELLEFSGKKVVEAFKMYPSLHEKIWRFFEKRLFSNIALRSELFKDLTLEEIFVCHDYFTSMDAPEGRLLLVEKKPVLRLSFIAQGQCERVNASGEKETLSAGQFFGEDFLGETLSTSRVTAKTSTYILECPRESFEKLCELLPKLKKNAELLSKKNPSASFPQKAVID